MFFSAIFPLAMLVATAAADLHDSCRCVDGTNSRWELTSAACSSYNAAGWKWGSTTFDNGSGRCVAVPGAHIAGDQWEEACQTLAQHIGFPCPDDPNHGATAVHRPINGRGTCYSNPATVRGQC